MTVNIPKNLFDGTFMYLPPEVVSGYKRTIDEYGLRKLAESCQKDSAIGGKTKSEAQKHFARQFLSSFARLQCAVLDPKNQLGEIPSRLLSTLGSGKVAWIDAACGAGATSLGILHTMAALGIENIVPSLPLEVRIVAGDISEHAMDIFEEFHNRTAHSLLSENISMTLSCYPWDAFDSTSTSSLVDAAVRYPYDEEYLVTIGATGGFLHSKFKNFKPSYEHLWTRLSNYPAVLFHVETQINESKHLIGRVIDYLTKRPKFLQKIESITHKKPIQFDAEFMHPLKKGENVPSRGIVCGFQCK